MPAAPEQRWTPEEDEIVRRTYRTKISFIQKNFLPHRSIRAIGLRRHSLGLRKHPRTERYCVVLSVPVADRAFAAAELSGQSVGTFLSLIIEKALS